MAIFLRIEEDCISCGLCEDICPEVFLVQDISTIIDDINYSEYEAKIREASDDCPMDVIRIFPYATFTN